MTLAKMNTKTIYVGDSEPATIYDWMIWINTSTKIVSYRDADTSSWVPMAGGKIVIAFDDTAVTQTGTSETEKKYARFIKSSNVSMNTIRVLASLKTSNASGTAYLKVYMDSDVTASLTLSTTATSETVVEGTFDISGLADGIHTLKIKIYNGKASYTTTNYIVQVYAEP